MIISYAELPVFTAAIYNVIDNNIYVLISNFNAKDDIIAEINKKINAGETQGII